MIGVLWVLGFAFAVAAGIGAGALSDGTAGGGMMATAEALLGAEAMLLALIGLALVTIGAGVLRRLDALVERAHASSSGDAVPSARGRG